MGLLKKSLTTSSNILDSFYIKNAKYLTYNSSYLDAANSSSESTIDKFFLQKILTFPLSKPMSVYLNNLLNYIDINEGNLSIVVTDSPNKQ
ncbi:MULTISPECIES: hypothetical protein [spotted fever group]|uniref:hypothetical protein n=1 Tax=spotted fever group TaxID=114277 RepID=UPI000169C741|nr:MULTISPECIES: hypothetical protein [spotted fever group]QWB86006.1 hypothetical protein JRD95_00048 [Rickettsia parkeri]